MAPVADSQLPDRAKDLGLPRDYTFPDYAKVLGKGSFGEVYLCCYKPVVAGPIDSVVRPCNTAPPPGLADGDGELVAVKVYSSLRNLKLKDLEYLRREVVCQRRLNHQHVIGFREVGLTADMRLYLALEYADSGNLREWLDARGGRLQEPLARWFLQQLVYGLDYCHAHGVYNRDIKPANLLLHAAAMSPEMPLLKVADFGLCKSTQESAPHTRVGSPFYMAPEVFSHRQYDGRKADVFSCGVVLYEMVFGKLPFERSMAMANVKPSIKSLVEFYRNIDDELPASILAGPKASGSAAAPPSPTPELMDLLRGMLRFDPAKRLSMHDIKRHAFYKQGLSDAVYQMVLEDPAVDTRGAQGQHRPHQSVELIEAEFERIIAYCKRRQEDEALRALEQEFEC